MWDKDLAVGKQRVNALLFFSLANACLRGRCVLLYGGMGANKTSLVNLLGSSFLSLGLDEVEDLMVTGHPEQTEEKIVGFLIPGNGPAPRQRDLLRCSGRPGLNRIGSSSMRSTAFPAASRTYSWRYCKRGRSAMRDSSAGRATPATLPP